MSLDSLHSLLNNHLKEQSENYHSFIYAQKKGFYQGYDAIKIDGCRSTEKGFKEYGILRYLKPQQIALDIGSNCGFFSLYVAQFVKEIHGVEFNPFLVDIANDTKKYLKINNAHFHHSPFENFKSEQKFDVIFSLANDSTIDRNMKFNFFEYVEKILDLLSDSGFLFLESQAADMVPESKFKPKFDYLKKFFKVIQHKKINSEYPVNVPERFFLILKKF